MFRLAHLSDPHLGPLPPATWRELAGKRLTGYLNWRAGRTMRHRPEVLEAVLADIAAEAPDHVAVTGDLVNIGLAGEMAPARALLQRIGPPERVTVVPGNHDVYHRATVEAMYREWRPWLEGDPEDERPDRRHAFPFVRRRGKVALIGANSGVPTPPFFATGVVGTRQISALAAMLDTLREEGLARVLLIHHPPFDIGWQKRLDDYAALTAMLRRTGAELVLHGHTHKATRTMLNGPEGPIPIVGAPSASSAGGGDDEAAAWNLVTIAGGPGAWSVEVERRRPAYPRT